MAFKKTLFERFFSANKFTSPSLTTCRIASSSMVAKSQVSHNSDKIMARDPGDDGVFQRFLHQSAVKSLSEIRSLPIGEKLREKLRGMDITGDRIKLDGLVPPRTPPESDQLRVADARKLLRLSQLEMVKLRLRQIEKNWISRSDFLEICMNETCSNVDQALEFVKLLDESGNVVVLGNAVFLRPDQVVKAMQELMSIPLALRNHETQTIKELEQMEDKKLEIDKKAESLVKKELWFGLSLFIIQTTTFMRFTFWDLTWDVMEPICFYITSFYFMAGYTFFLKTSKEPSFEGFFKVRFSTKQKKLMQLHNFDLQRYNELKRAYHYPHQNRIKNFEFMSSQS